MVQLYVILPVGDGGGHIDNSLPGGQGGRPSHPIYHPGHPDHGLPSSPGHPANRPPGSGSGNRPDNSLPPGGETIPPDQIGTPLPEPPPPYNDKTVVAIKQPGEPWVYKAYDQDLEIDNSPPSGGARPDNELPATPQPKGRHR